MRQELRCDKEKADRVWEKANFSDVMLGFEPRGEHATAMVMTDGVLLSITAALYQTLGKPLPEGMKPMTDETRTFVLKMVANTMGTTMNNYFDTGFLHIKEEEDAVSDE